MTLIRPGSKLGDPVPWSQIPVCVLKYTPDGVAQYTLNFADNYLDLSKVDNKCGGQV